MTGQPLAVPADGCLNLIHVDDAASVVLAAELRAPLPRLYVVSDGQPVERRSYYEELARLLRARRPASFRLPPAARLSARSATDKRIDNTRMRDELAVRLAYPSYLQGLASIVAAEEAVDKSTAG